jgi:hypothetical protein
LNTEPAALYILTGGTWADIAGRAHALERA